MYSTLFRRVVKVEHATEPKFGLDTREKKGIHQQGPKTVSPSAKASGFV